LLPVADGVGMELRSLSGRGGAPTPHQVAGESTAMNGTRRYDYILGMQASPYYHGDGQFHVDYTLNKAGDWLPSRGDGSELSRVFFTDSIGGSGDNGGAWTIYDIDYD
jgi:hypothetical protein